MVVNFMYVWVGSLCDYEFLCFCNEPATPEMYACLHALSLHDALPVAFCVVTAMDFPYFGYKAQPGFVAFAELADAFLDEEEPGQLLGLGVWELAEDVVVDLGLTAVGVAILGGLPAVLGS